MAERVVDVLEAVDVDDRDRELAVLALGGGDAAGELGAELGAVRQAGELVVKGEMLDRRLALAHRALHALELDAPGARLRPPRRPGAPRHSRRRRSVAPPVRGCGSAG